MAIQLSPIRNGLYFIAVAMFAGSFFLPTLRFPSRTYTGWDAARLCVDETIQSWDRRNRVRPALKFFLLQSPPAAAVRHGVQCLIGFALFIATVGFTRPSVVWFRFGVAIAMVLLALSIPFTMEEHRAKCARMDMSIRNPESDFNLQTVNPGVSDVESTLTPHRNWSIGYFFWTGSFLLLATGSTLELFCALRNPDHRHPAGLDSGR